MTRPLISIVTCCYNSASTIERTIKSILEQDFYDYEYIIIDGKSSDRTIDIIKEYEPKFNGKLRWISEKDKGIYDAMNKGILKSQGEYVWLVNSDDYIEEDALKRIAQVISTHHPEIICGYIEYFSEISDHRHIFKYSLEESEKEFKKKRMGIVHPATIVAKEVYNRYGLYDDAFYISADMDWFLRIKENNVPIEFVDIKLSNMSDAGISSQSNNVKKRIHDWKLLFSKHTHTKIEYWSFMLYRIATFYKTFVFK